MQRQRRTTPKEWTNSRVLDAETFLDIACSARSSTPSSGREAPEPSMAFDEESLGQLSTDDSVQVPAEAAEARTTTKDSDAQGSDQGLCEVKAQRTDSCSLLVVFLVFCAQIVVHSLVVPFMCTVAMIPLYLKETPIEIWMAYYWFATCSAALYFSEHVARRGLGIRMKTVSMLCVGLLCVILCTFETVVMGRGSSTRNAGIIGFVAVMLALYAPIAFRMIDFIRKGYTTMPLLWFILFMTWGASPTVTTVMLYLGLVALEWKNDMLMVGVCVALWSVTPFFVKAVGWKPVYHGCPKAKFCAPVLWILYCDLAFGTLGLPLFMHNPRASLTYAASIGPILFLHMARGAGWFSWCCLCRRRVETASERRVMRLNSFLEALCAVQGRAVAYTVYFTMMGLNVILGVNGDASQLRYSLIDGGESPFTGSIQIYRHTSPSGTMMLAAIFGLVISWGAFCLFSWFLPYVWARSSVVAPADCPGASYQVDAGKHGAGWMLGGDRSQTLHQQYQVITAFFRKHMHDIISMYVFQMAITVAAVNLAEYFIKTNT